MPTTPIATANRPASNQVGYPTIAPPRANAHTLSMTARNAMIRRLRAFRRARLIAKRTRLDRRLHRIDPLPDWQGPTGPPIVLPDAPVVTPIDSALRRAVREHRDTPGAVITERDLRLYRQLGPASDSPERQARQYVFHDGTIRPQDNIGKPQRVGTAMG